MIAPTRELAVQVAEELNRIGQVKGVRTLPIYGGQDISRQIRSLKNRPQIIAATPGRLIDHIERRTIRLNNIKMVVLDEADEMLNMGFIEDIERILSEVPEERQTLLFSATMPKRIQGLAERFMVEPELVKVKAKEMTVTNIEQYYLETHEKQKFDVLTGLLDIESPELAIVFGRTKRRVDEVVEGLIKRGYSAEGIHGDIPQAKRDQVIRRFKDGSIEIMVATDVAARGLDISGVSHVYNFDIPQDPESYVHRIGRTGRAGKKGVAMTFITPREKSYLHVVERTTKRKMEKMRPPTLDEALEGQQKAVLEKILQSIESNNLQYYRQAAEELLEQQDAATVVAAVLKMLTKEPDTTPVKLTEEKPLPSKRDYRGGQDRRGKFDPKDKKRGPYKPRQSQGQGQGSKRNNTGGKPRSNSYK